MRNSEMNHDYPLRNFGWQKETPRFPLVLFCFHSSEERKNTTAPQREGEGGTPRALPCPPIFEHSVLLLTERDTCNRARRAALEQVVLSHDYFLS